MVAHWWRVGFVHGVMNTDNMSILGLTIDYGPYGWLEGYDPIWTPNTTDADRRRYCYGNQPAIALWNLERLAAALHPVFAPLGLRDTLESGLESYRTGFEQTQREMLAGKLGISALRDAADEELASDLMQLMNEVETDMTIFFRGLSALAILGEASADDRALTLCLADAFYRPLDEDGDYLRRLATWIRRYIKRVNTDSLSPAARLACMHQANPKYVLRNYLAHQAIEAIERDQDLGPLELLAKVLQLPYDEQPQYAAFAGKRPEWARDKPGCSALSCSS